MTSSRSESDPSLRALDELMAGFDTFPRFEIRRQLRDLRAALAAAEAAPLDVDALMDRLHRWCIQVEGEWALGHEVEAHRKQAEFILVLRSPDTETERDPECVRCGLPKSEHDLSNPYAHGFLTDDPSAEELAAKGEAG